MMQSKNDAFLMIEQSFANFNLKLDTEKIHRHEIQLFTSYKNLYFEKRYFCILNSKKAEKNLLQILQNLTK